MTISTACLARFSLAMLQDAPSLRCFLLSSNTFTSGLQLNTRTLRSYTEAEKVKGLERAILKGIAMQGQARSTPCCKTLSGMCGRCAQGGVQSVTRCGVQEFAREVLGHPEAKLARLRADGRIRPGRR